MGPEPSCKGCNYSHTCGRVYEQLGNTDGPSVTVKVIVAFLLPIVVFVGVLGVSEQLLRGIVARSYETLAASALATCVTVGLVLVVSGVAKRRHRNKQHPE